MVFAGSLNFKNRFPPDPFASDVVLYLKGDDSNGSTTIIDSSPLAYTMSVFDNAQISTNRSKYGGSSILFDGTGDYLTTTGTAIGTDLFTAECWFYSTSTANAQGLLGANINEAPGPSWEIRFNGSNGSINSWWNSYTNYFLSSAGTTPLNQWNHVAMVRTSSDIRLYCNGTLAATSTTNYTNNLSRTSYVIGRTYSNSNIEYLTGNIDSARVTKGIARYTSNFDPETDTYLAY